MKKLPILSILSFVLFYSCNSNDNAVDATFDINTLLSDVTNTMILPSLTDFQNNALNLQQLTETYVEEVSEANLNALRNQWNTTAISYEKTYVFHIGEARSRFLHQAIYNWPTIPESLDNFILNNEITEEVVAAISPQIKALAGLEYLLYSDNLATTNARFINDEKRLEYLRLSVNFLITQANRLHSIWSTSGENYATTFINNEGTGTNESINLLYNGINNIIDTGKVTKIGKPAGLESSEMVNTEIVQAPFSELSLELLLQNIETVEAVLFSDSITNISDYITFIAKDDVLITELQDLINQIKQDIAAIPVPLNEALISNATEVENLHTHLGDLNILLTVDLRSTLSIIITATDNDGD